MFAVLCVLIVAMNVSAKRDMQPILYHPLDSKYVDPFIGTGFHGHVFLGANIPFGAVQLGPVNLSEGWDWCSGYHYSDSTIIGFSHTHLSGTGIGDLGDILLMPATGDVIIDKGNAEATGGGQYFSVFITKKKQRGRATTAFVYNGTISKLN